MLKVAASLFAILLSVLVVAGQGGSGTSIRVSGWKVGAERIRPQAVEIVLDGCEGGFRQDVTALSGKVYRLSVRAHYFSSLAGDHWKVELREVLRTRGRGKALLGDDLLFVERPGSGGDNFPREDLIAFFYPGDTRYTVNGIPWAEGSKPFYPIDTVRIVKVDGFEVELRVEKTSRPVGKRSQNAIKIVVDLRNTP